TLRTQAISRCCRPRMRICSIAAVVPLTGVVCGLPTVPKRIGSWLEEAIRFNVLSLFAVQLFAARADCAQERFMTVIDPTHPRERDLMLAFAAFAVAVLLWQLDGLSALTYPLRLFVTMIHELGH